MTIEDLEERLNTFEQSLIQMGINLTPTINKVDDTANKVVAITPYTSTKIGYYGDTEMNFYEVPQGNVEVFFNGENRACTLDRVKNRLTVKFGALTDRTNITIIVK